MASSSTPPHFNEIHFSREDHSKFVQYFRQASPYIEGHRARTFVIVIPGMVSTDKSMLFSILSDISLLHGLGVKVVLVVGVQNQTDRILRERQMLPRYLGGYRITDLETMRVTTEAAGEVRTLCEQALSKGPFIPMIRRHTKASDTEIHFEPALNVVSGNYITAKRRGVVNGTDYGLTGEVRFVMKDPIQKQLDLGNIVLLSNLGFTASGEVLNCNTYDVGFHAAVGLKADKLFVLHQEEVQSLGLPAWLPLNDAQAMLRSKLESMLSEEQMDQFNTSMDLVAPPSSPLPSTTLDKVSLTAYKASSALRLSAEQLISRIDLWSAGGFPLAVSTCVMACTKGVKRAHLLDARVDGGLLLELYSRDGVGTMISADFYEGLRKANQGDVEGVQSLLLPLEKEGILVKRSKEELEAMMGDFIVIERETKLMGCAMLLPLGCTEEGVSVAEVGAFCVDPIFRGSGRGDSMLDYVEQDARKRGVQRLVLLTTRTADWFEQRDFKHCGPAYSSALLPNDRRAKISPARNSQLYVKELEVAYDSLPEPGKRIGY